jgi:hypothetical protein
MNKRQRETDYLTQIPCTGRLTRGVRKETEKQQKEAVLPFVLSSLGPLSIIVLFLDCKDLLILSMCSLAMEDVTKRAWEVMDVAEPVEGKSTSTVSAKFRSVRKAKAAQFASKMLYYRYDMGPLGNAGGEHLVPDLNVKVFEEPGEYEFFVSFLDMMKKEELIWQGFVPRKGNRTALGQWRGFELDLENVYHTMDWPGMKRRLHFMAEARDDRRRYIESPAYRQDVEAALGDVVITIVAFKLSNQNPLLVCSMPAFPGLFGYRALNNRTHLIVRHQQSELSHVPGAANELTCFLSLISDSSPLPQDDVLTTISLALLPNVEASSRAFIDLMIAGGHW